MDNKKDILPRAGRETMFQNRSSIPQSSQIDAVSFFLSFSLFLGRAGDFFPVFGDAFLPSLFTLEHCECDLKLHVSEVIFPAILKLT